MKGMHVASQLNLRIIERISLLKSSSAQLRSFRCSAVSCSGTAEASKELSSKLTDPDLLRSRGYIGGAWVEAADQATFEVPL